MEEMRDEYLEYVQTQAGKLGKVFFLDSGEGKDFFDEKRQWYIEEMTGWLIDKANEEKALSLYRCDELHDNFPDTYVLVMWSYEGEELQIRFKYL